MTYAVALDKLRVQTDALDALKATNGSDRRKRSVVLITAVISGRSSKLALSTNSTVVQLVGGVNVRYFVGCCVVAYALGVSGCGNTNGSGTVDGGATDQQDAVSDLVSPGPDGAEFPVTGSVAPTSGVWTWRVTPSGPFVAEYYRADFEVDQTADGAELRRAAVAMLNYDDTTEMFVVEDVPIDESGGFEFVTEALPLGGSFDPQPLWVKVTLKAPDFLCGEIGVGSTVSSGVSTTLAGRLGDFGPDHRLPASCDQAECFGDGGETFCGRYCRDDWQCFDDEYCNPSERPIGGTTWPEGVCVRGEDCEPGREEEACAAESSTCALVNRSMACAPAGVARLGDVCTVVFDDDVPTNCAAGLVCAYGACRASCETGCDASTSCADWTDHLHEGAAEVQLCVEVCDVVQQSDCASGEHCVIRERAGAVVVAQCQPGGDGDGAAGEPCGWADDDVGTCTPGHVCRSLTYREPPVCVPLCTAVDTSLCALPTACRADQPDWGAALGICTADCAPFPGGTCGDDQRCVAAEVFLNAGGEEVLLGSCAVPGPRVTGEGEYVGMSDPKVCDERLVPVPSRGLGRAKCTRACRVDGEDGAICDDQERCRPFAEAAPVWGYCAPLTD